ncbi:hypothetical protein C8R43DRAFT_1096756 [Mycena crocata]|nr:hypothetical protein C8R43DRAFT_1096756 [Mycena crocata]
MPSVDENISFLKNAVDTGPPACSGTCQLSADQTKLIYGLKDDGRAQWVDLFSATPEQLDTVSGACQRATFGRNQEDVLDETYRKAGQMSATDFVITFDLGKSGIIDSVHAQLLEGFNDSDKHINAELYKLNIYDKGSFFKAHKDTPRGENMFGSLVVIFPTFHIGGALHLRYSDKEEIFDSSQTLSPFNTPTVAYVAFYGDVEHEVAVVESGHRVTLTYNLYFADGPSPPSASISARDSAGPVLKSALSALLAHPEFLPKGGILGFGLRYEYPIDMNTNLVRMKSLLKGADALLIRICEELQLRASLKVVYSDPNRDGGEAMMDKLPDIRHRRVEGSVIKLLQEEHGASLLEAPNYTEVNGEITEINWITELSGLNDLKSVYIAYGNEASLGLIYGDLALVVDIDGSRMVQGS